MKCRSASSVLRICPRIRADLPVDDEATSCLTRAMHLPSVSTLHIVTAPENRGPNYRSAAVPCLEPACECPSGIQATLQNWSESVAAALVDGGIMRTRMMITWRMIT